MLTDGTLFPLAALAIVLPLFMPVAVALYAGEAVAGEAQTGTLRYLLVRPVGRTRLIVAKLVMILAFVLLAVAVVAAVGYVVGVLLLGDGATGQAVTGISGNTLSTAELVQRTLMSIVYVALSMLGVAALALLLSTVSDSPLAAAMGALAFLIASTLLLTLDAAEATGWPSSTSSATRSCGASWSGACSCRGCTSWCSSARPGPTSPPRT